MSKKKSRQRNLRSPQILIKRRSRKLVWVIAPCLIVSLAGIILAQWGGLRKSVRGLDAMANGHVSEPVSGPVSNSMPAPIPPPLPPSREYIYAGNRLVVTDAPLQAVAAPGNLAMDPCTGSFITWADNSNNETGFIIERSTDGQTYGFYTTVDANVSWSTIPWAKTNPAYYRVRATNNGVDSLNSAALYAQNPGCSNPGSAPPPPVSNSLVLNSSTAYVNVQNSASLNITGPITVEAWVKISINGTFINRIASRYSDVDGGFALDLYQNKVKFSVLENNVSGDTVYGSTALTPNIWYHVAGVADGSQIRVYVNGALDGSKASAWLPGSGSSPLQIGPQYFQGVLYFQFPGLIDEVRVTAGSIYNSDFVPLTHLSPVAETRGMWKFDGQTANDTSGNYNHGTLMGGASYSTDVPSYNSLAVNGSTDYVSVPTSASLNITGPITVEAWVKTTNSGLFIQRIVSRYTETDGGYILDLYYGKPRFMVLRNVNLINSATGSAALTPNAWHHLAGVADGSQIRVYVDGVQAGMTSSTWLPYSGTGAIELGMTTSQGALYFPFNGLLDEIRVTSGALYNGTFTPERHLSAGANTGGLWKFDAQTTNDFSRNGNNGTRVGGASYFSDVPRP
jgi:hypothetical protein